MVANSGGTPDAIQNTVSILTLLLLYTEFILLVRFWGWQVYGQPNLLWRYGLEFTRRSGLELLTGLAIGVFSLFALFGTQSILGWVIWKVPSASWLRIVLEGGLVSLGLGFAEELFFRGWLLDEFQRDYRPKTALWASAGIYAALHFIKPLEELLRTIITFPALLLLGATLVWAKRSRSNWEDGFWRGRLGLPIGLHAGLVWGYYIVNVGQLVDYSSQAPAWITGIDRNPLAGIMGLLFLTLLFLGMKRQAVGRGVRG
ncbi:CPBP family intramembrane glutamic endopeptidase [Leptothermofonsia sp. ETS-13]|uniref:CPBP family intramembrane glutamic endopeptidase n=1 Tax=Leptothermofonsia sp. ETS-13 TaxID=3035696 RepID=UPI003B9EBC45